LHDTFATDHHDEPVFLTRLIQASCVIAAYALVGLHISWLAEASAILHWYLPLVLVAAWCHTGKVLVETNPPELFRTAGSS